MSDFDDEPDAGSRSTTGDEGDPAPTSRRRPRAQDEDVWDDEPAPRAKRSRTRPVDLDDDDEPVRPARGRSARSVDEDDDDWDDDWDDDRGGGKRDLTLVFAIAAAVLVIALVVVLTRPKDDDTEATQNTTPGATQPADAPPNKNWQGPVGEAVGDIDGRIAGEDGVFIWTGFDGWHVRNKSGQEVTVVITAPKVGETVDGQPKGDLGDELTLTVPSGDGTSGSDFDLSDSEVASISVLQGQTPVAAEQIKLGGATGVATANPVELTKA